jgi:hypothetical protein
MLRWTIGLHAIKISLLVIPGNQHTFWNKEHLVFKYKLAFLGGMCASARVCTLEGVCTFAGVCTFGGMCTFYKGKNPFFQGLYPLVGVFIRRYVYLRVSMYPKRSVYLWRRAHIP